MMKILLGSFCLLSARVVLAEPPVTAAVTSSVIELTWNESPPEKMRLAVALPAERGCSTLSLDQERRELRLSACRVGDPQSTVVELELERIDRADGSGGANARTKLKSTMRLTRGVPAVIGRFERSQGSGEIVVLLR